MKIEINITADEEEYELLKSKTSFNNVPIRGVFTSLTIREGTVVLVPSLGSIIDIDGIAFRPS